MNSEVCSPWCGSAFRKDGRSCTTIPARSPRSSSKGRVKKGLLHRKLIRPVVDLLKQGVTPEKMALSLALGAAIGVFPAIGWTTALCAIAALALRLNLAAIQIVN